MFPIKNLEELLKLNESVFLENQIKVLRLQDKLGEQIYRHDRNNSLEPMTDANKRTSQDITKTITETSYIYNKVLEKLNEKFSDLLNDKGMIAHTLAPSLAILFRPENKNQLRFKKTFIRLG